MNQMLLRLAKVAISLVWYGANRIIDYNGRRKQLVILYYHAVREDAVAQFSRQISALKAYADIVPADYVGSPGRRPKAAITFDDAFESVFENALPKLKDAGVPSTIFVPIGQMGANPDWQMETAAIDRAEVVANENRLRSLSPDLVTLGAHSRTHPHLTQVGDAHAQDEIAGAKVDMEKMFGLPVTLFAFPYGDFDDRALRLCANAGYRFVFSIGPGSIPVSDQHMLRPRVSVDPTDHPLEFWLKIRGAYDWMPSASSLKHRLLGAKRKRESTPA